MAEAPSVLFVGPSGDEPIRLSGPPLRLTGQVRLRNPQSLSLVLRNAGLVDRSGRLTDLPAHHGFAPVVLQPAEERGVPLVIGLDPTTPPGEYHVDLDLMGQTRSAVLNVAELVALRVEPKRIVVMPEADQPRRAQLVVTNDGNVSLSVGPIGDVDLRDDVAEVRELRGLVAPALAEVPRDLDDLLSVLLAVVPAQGPIVGRLCVRSLSERVELAPGRTAKIDLEITVPPNLPANSRYRGRVAVLTANLEFIVVTHSQSRVGEPPHTPAPHAPNDVDHPQGPSPQRTRKGARR
jgi:hypothetical protein